MTRRQFLKSASLAALGGALGAGGYGLMEAKWLRVNRVTLPVPNLPLAFAGKTVAFMADLHHGPFVPLSYVEHAVNMVNGLKPDLITLGGDYPHMSVRYIAPCIGALARLRAPLGVYAVLGNHDHYFGGQPHTTAALRDACIPELTNHGLWIESNGGRLWLCGVDDCRFGKPDLPPAAERRIPG